MKFIRIHGSDFDHRIHCSIKDKENKQEGRILLSRVISGKQERNAVNQGREYLRILGRSRESYSTYITIVRALIIMQGVTVYLGSSE